ncbi:MAG: hypothetical protein E2590_02265 [Chryseobacterium sp.]|nr:hypothetical protein [Chryseobacterium sp.]
MDFNNINVIEEFGFSGFKTIEELTTNKSLIPKENGVCLILNLEKEIKFLEKGTGGYFKGKNPNVEIEILQKKWVNETNIVYIGKATNLQKRLNQYFCFGDGKMLDIMVVGLFGN